MNAKYEIVYQSDLTGELISVDTAKTVDEAKRLESEYKMAFKTDFIYIQ